MVTHLVLLKPRADLTTIEREMFVAAFERAMTEIPTVRGVRVGSRVVHDAGYEQGMPDTADFLAVVDFDDLEGLKAYLRHPTHEELGILFGRFLASAMVYDFDTGGTGLLRQFI